MSHVCEFCNSIFTTKSILNTHRISAKKCLKNRIQLDKDKNECEHCKKQFTTKQNLNQHLNICSELKIQKESDKKVLKVKEDYEEKVLQLTKENKDHEIEKSYLLTKIKMLENSYEKQVTELQKQVTELQDKLERLCSKAIDKPASSSTTTNNTNNISLSQHFDMNNDAYFENKIYVKFNENYIHNGLGGVADFICDNIIRNSEGLLLYKCTDTARQMFKYIDDNGNLIKDPKASKLISKLQSPLIKHSCTFINFCDREAEIETDIKQKEKLLLIRDKMSEVGVDVFGMHKNSKLSSELAKRISQ